MQDHGTPARLFISASCRLTVAFGIPSARAADDAPAFWQLGNLWRLMASGHQTGNALSFIDQLVTGSGGGPASHMHPSDEGLYVVSGQCTFGAAGEKLCAGPGSLVVVPRFTEHAFTVDKPGTHLLNFYVPAGVELFLVLSAHPVERNELPPENGVPPPPAWLVDQLTRTDGSFSMFEILAPRGTGTQPRSAAAKILDAP